MRAFARVRSRKGSGRRTSSYNSRLMRQSKVLFLATSVAGLPYRAQSRGCQRQQQALSASAICLSCVASML